MNFLEKTFKLKEHNTNVKTEVMAGITTFMTMAYILVVHPFFMSTAGMDIGAVTTITALFTGVFTLLMALYTNLPYALAPAMGSNAFFAFTLVAGGIVTWEVGLGMVFVSGAIFVLLTVFGLREVIVKMVPKNIKLAIGAAVGLFITQLGFKSGNIMLIKEGSIKMQSLHNSTTILAIIGLLITIIFMSRKVKGGILWGIIITTIIGIPMGITQVPEQFFSLPPSIAPIAFKLDILGALKLVYFPFMFTFFVGDFFSTLGTLLGVSGKAGFLDENGNLPNIGKPFLVDAVATVTGALFGSTTITTYIESASGVEEGGRTGLTSTVTAICFLLTLFVTPIAGMIPSAATAPALILIGLMMMSGLKNIDFDDFTESLPAFATLVFVAFTSSISNGISAGILIYVFVKVVTGKFRDIHWGMYLLCLPLIYYFLAI